eukprot:TRINITY_DN9763_c0_g2_i1.p1 TRINITY_DN9763_c0_g2~~TRINITY_DN9763_c0_g2_i1.p1  ORF type:complete len:595 (+),score=150.37 TRINITY_DN9763_c0_g2_i1:160-1944(+)
MTERSKVERYNALSTCKDELESHLFTQLYEHINAEIALGSIANLAQLTDYLASTFFFIRMRKNPSKYGVPAGNVTHQALRDFVLAEGRKVLNALAAYELVEFDAESGRVKPREMGVEMSKTYVAFATVKALVDFDRVEAPSTKEAFGPRNMLRLLSESAEFEKYRSKIEERKTLHLYNKAISFKSDGVATAAKKVFVLLQCAFDCVAVEDWELKKQQKEILSVAWRILLCYKRYFSKRKEGRGMLTSMRLMKSIYQRTWRETPEDILRQIPGIGEKLAGCLVKAGAKTFADILKMNAIDIELACAKNKPFGLNLQNTVRAIPKLSLKVETTTVPGTGALKETKISVAVDRSSRGDELIGKIKEEELRGNYCLLVLDRNERLLKQKFYSMSDRSFLGDEVTLQLRSLMPPIQVLLLNDKFFGLDESHTIRNGEPRPAAKAGNVSISKYMKTGERKKKPTASETISTASRTNPEVEMTDDLELVAKVDEILGNLDQQNIGNELNEYAYVGKSTSTIPNKFPKVIAKQKSNEGVARKLGPKFALSGVKNATKQQNGKPQGTPVDESSQQKKTNFLAMFETLFAVSYTHLTLPTIYSV